MKKIKAINNNRGFTILFASLIGSLVMQIGMAILGVTLMQIDLASAGRESQHAFYSADTGTECALFLNYGGGNPGAYDTEVCASGGVFPSRVSEVVCDQSDAEGTPMVYMCGQTTLNPAIPDTFTSTWDESTENMTTTFRIPASSENVCYAVSVIKNATNNTTNIESRGYSKCEGGNIFERAINTNF